MPSFWCGKSERTENTVDTETKTQRGENFEEEPEGASVGVAIKELRKVYKVSSSGGSSGLDYKIT